MLRDFPGNLKIALSDAPSFHYAIAQQIRPFGYAAYRGRRRVPLRPEARRGDEIEHCLGRAFDGSGIDHGS